MGFFSVSKNFLLTKILTVFSGIGFVDFIECIPIAVENMLLMKSDYFWNSRDYLKFEIAEGKEEIDRLTRVIREEKFKHGDFSFVDYADAGLLSRLNDDNIAELLYLAHMIKPLRSPFFDVLQNNFVYLSHDDDWCCNLYCREHKMPIEMLLNKLCKVINEAYCDDTVSLPEELIEATHELSLKGLLINADISVQRKKTLTISFYEVGGYENIDVLFDSFDDKELSPSYELRLT